MEFEDLRANPEQSSPKLDAASCKSRAGGQGGEIWMLELVGQPMSRPREILFQETKVEIGRSGLLTLLCVPCKHTSSPPTQRVSRGPGEFRRNSG